MKDAFESDYMDGGEEVRHRDKRVSRMMAGVLAAPALFMLIFTFVLGFGNAAASKPVPEAYLPLVLGAMLAFAAMFFVMSVTFAVLRTVVTHREVNIKYGLWGPTIPLEHIDSERDVQ